MKTKYDSFIIKTDTPEEGGEANLCHSRLSDREYPRYRPTLDSYLDHFHKTPSLVICAARDGKWQAGARQEVATAQQAVAEVIGSTFGTIEEDHMLAGCGSR